MHDKTNDVVAEQEIVQEQLEQARSERLVSRGAVQEAVLDAFGLKQFRSDESQYEIYAYETAVYTSIT